MQTTEVPRMSPRNVEIVGGTLRIRHIGGVVQTVFTDPLMAEIVGQAIRDYIGGQDMPADRYHAGLVMRIVDGFQEGGAI